MEQVKITVPEKIVEFSTGLIQRAMDFIIDSDEMDVEVTDILTRIKRAIKDINAEEKRHTLPLQVLKQGYIDEYKPIRAPFTEAKNILEGKSIAWYHKKQDEAAKEQVRLRREETLKQKKLDEEKAALEAKGINLVLPEQEKTAPPIVTGPDKKVSGVYSSKTIKESPAFRVVDFAKLPDKHKLVNQVSLNQAAKEGVQHIEGCERYMKPSLTSRVG